MSGVPHSNAFSVSHAATPVQEVQFCSIDDLLHGADLDAPLVALIGDGVTMLEGCVESLVGPLRVVDTAAGASALLLGLGVRQPPGLPHPGWSTPGVRHTRHARPSLACCVVRREVLQAALARGPRTEEFAAHLQGVVEQRGLHWVQAPRALAVTWRPDLAASIAPEQGPSVLVLDACTPTPDQDSGSADAFNYMKLLRSLGWRVTFIPVSNFLHFGRYTHELEDLGVQCVYQPYFSTVAGFLKESRRPFELVMLFRVDIAAAQLPDVRRLLPHAKTLFVTVDLHFLRLEREARLTGDATTLARARETARRELDIISRCDLSAVISDAEYSLIRSLAPEARLSHLPIIRQIPGRRQAFAARSGVAFIGGYRHPPNVDAVTSFVEQTWPSIRTALPETSLYIVGPDAPPALRNVKADGVEFVGYVPDLADILDRVRLTVAPLRFGAGQKGKIVSSLSYGVPVVCSALAGEGMGLADEVNCLIRDDPAGFAEAVVRLYQSEQLWTRLSDAGLRLVTEEFSMSRGRAALSGALAELGFGTAPSGGALVHGSA